MDGLRVLDHMQGRYCRASVLLLTRIAPSSIMEQVTVLGQSKSNTTKVPLVPYENVLQIVETISYGEYSAEL